MRPNQNYNFAFQIFNFEIFTLLTHKGRLRFYFGALVGIVLISSGKYLKHKI